MPSFYRGAITAFIGTVILFLLTADSDNDRHESGRAQQPPKHEQEKTADAIPFIRDFQGTNTDPKAERDEWRKEKDLQAQRDMAYWSGGLFWVAFFTLWVTGAGVYVVARTLKATRDAVDSANEATKAAHDTNEITRTFGHTQLRAYVSVSGQELNFENGFPVPIITMKNFGNTPAVDVFHYCILTIREFPLESDLLVTNTEPHKMSQSVLGPGGILKLSYPYGQRITGDIQSQIRKGKLGIYVYGELIYKDVFGESHTSKYCLICSGDYEFTHRRLMGYYQGNEIT